MSNMLSNANKLLLPLCACTTNTAKLNLIGASVPVISTEQSGNMAQARP